MLGRHILPHLLPVVGAYAALSVGWAVLFESALGFLGAGVQEPEASIGSMLGQHLIYYRSHPALIVIPAVFLGVMVMAANLVGESLRTRTRGALMGWYVVRRLLAALVTVWIVATAGFLLVEIIPGDPARQLAGPGASAASLAAIREAYGFDDPLPMRYVESLTRMAQGDLGYSFAKAEPVIDVLLAITALHPAADGPGLRGGGGHRHPAGAVGRGSGRDSSTGCWSSSPVPRPRFRPSS